MAAGQESVNPFEKPLTPCLVFGVAGRIGSGSSFVQHSLDKIIKTYGYVPKTVDISKFFLEEEYDKAFGDFRLGEGESQPEPATNPYVKTDDTSLLTRIVSLQRRGNHFRDRYGTNILAALSINWINGDLVESGAIEDRNIRRAYIIDSLKHPAEVRLLRDVFGGAFCMVGVVADDSIRKKRLQEHKHIHEKDFDKVSETDADERIGHGQQTLNAIVLSDYFFANNYDIPGKIDSECQRLLNLLFNSDIVTPRQDEFGMNLALMAADKSACLSRQVGAAIITQSGTVLATGHNDVPQFGGGLYSSESRKDERCFARSGLCYNDDEKRIITEEILDLLRSEKIKNLGEEQLVQIRDVLVSRTRLKTLIEFTRAVHAEMDAIISVAREGKIGIVGSTLRALKVELCTPFSLLQ